MTAKTRRTVVIATVLSESACQRKLAGVFSRLDVNSDWNVSLFKTMAEVRSPDFADAVRTSDGIIYNAEPQPFAWEILASRNVPTVILEADPPALVGRARNLVVIRHDPEQIAAHARATFDRLGRFGSFAFVPSRTPSEWSGRRLAAFRKAIPRGMRLAVFASEPRSAAADADGLVRFLRALPKPAAILAANDPRAADVLRAADAAGVNVPRQAAVLSVDNDPYVCDQVRPTLSSIEPDHFEEGRLAAQLLEEMFSRKPPTGSRRLFVDVKRVVLRDSTGFQPPAQTLVARAEGYIAAHACRGLSPGDVAAYLGVSRALLDLRFRQRGKATVGRLITDAKLQEVVRLLKATGTPIARIHARCGFANANALKNLFKSRFGRSMSDFRAAGC